MTDKPKIKYAVSASPLFPNINIGRVNAKGDGFLSDKEEATDMVLAAVGQYVAMHFEGAMAATFPGLGIQVEVRVTGLQPAPVLNLPEPDGEPDPESLRPIPLAIVPPPNTNPAEN